MEISLECSSHAFFIPAHIWTPWFSLLGSKSGFDSIEECFEDLSGHIYALETGLSSDPPMNWRLSSLDRYVLVSNSDAHSPERLGREANLFDTTLSYPDLVRAMMGRGGFGGTVEFFPEEGKYHFDGHRKCKVCLDPEETVRLSGRCPVCGRSVTVGVMNRVMALADRPAGEKPASTYPFYSLIPLTEIIGEVLGVGAKSKRVATLYEQLLAELGPELFILREAPLDEIARAGGELLSLAIARMRQNKVQAVPGYDGEFGRIKLFTANEREALLGQGRLFQTTTMKKRTTAGRSSRSPAKGPAPRPGPVESEPKAAPLLSLGDPLLDDLNPAQREGVTWNEGPLCIVAGPGTGKTLVLTRRMAWLVRERLALPEEILGLTFTRQAAGEMAARLAGLLPFRPNIKKTSVMTFHALGLMILNEYLKKNLTVLSEEDRLTVGRQVARHSPFKAAELLNRISLAKQALQGPEDTGDPLLATPYGRYEQALAKLDSVDFDDLLSKTVSLLERNEHLATELRQRFPWIMIDEYQDINPAQYRLTLALTGAPRPNLTVIGDPDQAIYGFRGADAQYFQRFQTDFSEAGLIRLTKNYRSSETVLRASGQVIAHNSDSSRMELVSGINGPSKLTTAELASSRAEAEYVVWQIEKLLGGASHFALDSGRVDSTHNPQISLGEIAVLYRLHALAQPIAEALNRAGLPFQQAGTEPGREADILAFPAEKINLLTMHAAKGLEFKVVFIIGLEEDILPYQPPQKAPADLAEERRLFYVSLTRARLRLYLTRSKKRTLFGRHYSPGPSIFLDEIGKSLKAVDQLPKRVHKQRAQQMALF